MKQTDPLTEDLNSVALTDGAGGLGRHLPLSRVVVVGVWRAAGR
jgi:hypothetical protein